MPTRAQAFKKKSSAKTTVKKPVDPAVPGKLALRGRIVTMDKAGRTLADGCIYIKDGVVVEIKNATAAPPAGFGSNDVVSTGGTIFPGLIELHNHLPYNILQLWNVPKRFTNRGQWGGHREYGLRISGPMKIIGESSTLMPAVIRYVEVKCVLAGVTTSQGIALFSNAGSRRYYRGFVRNVEQTSEAVLPEALTRVADVDAKSITSFHERLKKASCLLLHLSEGLDASARKHFLSLEEPGGSWAIEPSLAGIHCAALKSEDFKQMAPRKASMVWSPLSNLLLYGGTADIKAARAAKVNVCLGSDWSPTGSKNLLGELKVAEIWAKEIGMSLSAEDIVAMATTNPAGTLGWDTQLGSLEDGKKADLVVVAGQGGDSHEALVHATEADIRLVVINGIARHGEHGLMQALGLTGESLTIKGRKYLLNLAQETSDPEVGGLTFARAKQLLRDGLADLAKVASANKKAKLAGIRSKTGTETRRWFLALDELADTGEQLRPRLEFNNKMTGPSLALAKAPTPAELPSLKLDPVTVVDDADFIGTLKNQTVLPDVVADRLGTFYA